jgi:hypothetical protein
VLDASRLRLHHIALFAVPFVIGGAAFAMWATRDPEAFRAQILGNQAGERMGSLSHPLQAIKEDIDRYKYVFYGSQYDAGKFAPLKLVLLLTWVGGLLGRLVAQGWKDRVSLVLALCGIIPVVVLTFFNVKNAYYLIFIVPFLAANAGALFSYLWQAGPGTRRFGVAALGVTLAVSGAVTGKRALASRHEYFRYQDLSAKAASLAPTGQIIGPAGYAFAIGFDCVVQDDNLGFYSGRCPAVIIDAGLTPDEVENLQRGAPAVLEHRKRVLTVNYQPVERDLYRRLSCPTGTREN